MKRFCLCVWICAVLLACLCGCGKGRAPEEGPAFSDSPAVSDSPAPSAVQFPAFSGADILSGAELSSEDFSAHQLTVLNVWATWCGPCVNEIPELNELAESYAGEDVQVLGILLEEGESAASAAKELLGSLNVSYPVLQAEGELQTYLEQSILYFPTTFLVDSQGNILGEPVIGANDLSGWQEIVDSALESQAAA